MTGDDAEDGDSEGEAEIEREEDTDDDQETLSYVTAAAYGVASVRCAGHTLQLCVHDVISTDKCIKVLLLRFR